MSVLNVFKTTTSRNSPLDGSSGTAGDTTNVSDFLTVQTFMNFGAMTGAITVAWRGLGVLMPAAKSYWVPYGLAFGWAIISVILSIEGLGSATSGSTGQKIGTLLQGIFVAFINALVLAEAVVGTNTAIGQ